MAPAGLDLRFVLVSPRNPLNIGAAARALANFGFSDLALVRPYTEAWRQAKSARAGAAVLERARCFDGLEEALADREFVVGTSAATGRVPEIPVAAWPEVAAAWPALPSALLFGSEKTGLSVEDISHCHRLARIPTLPQAPSMNLGQAVAICCYELGRRQDNLAPAEAAAPPAAMIGGRERVVTQFRPILEHIGVFRSLHRASQTRRLRQMLLRWQLGPADIRLLLGVGRELRRVLHLRAQSEAETAVPKGR